ncbi:hypothetical protein, partial [Caulobacter sp. 17J80-11]|uniref:hypothetical protein n=1 Tax=Caulobacter sp. 17J80-11 TaxID=2763502 RepID=UPI0019B20F2F
MRGKHPILAGLLAGALALPPAAFAQAAKPMTAQEALAAAAAQLCDPKSPDQARRDACRWVAGGGAAGG